MPPSRKTTKTRRLEKGHGVQGSIDFSLCRWFLLQCICPAQTKVYATLNSIPLLGGRPGSGIETACNVQRWPRQRGNNPGGSNQDTSTVLHAVTRTSTKRA